MAVRLRDVGSSPDGLAEEARRACEALLRREVRTVETFAAPTGRVRESVRLRLDDGTVIATRRSDESSRQREIRVLQLLGGQGAPVPKVLAFDDAWLLQEDLGTTRLTDVLNDATRPDRGAWLDRGLRALDAVHRAARAAGLPQSPAGLTERQKRIEVYLLVFDRLRQKTGVPAPNVPAAALKRILAVPGTDFIKFDPNPADAIIGPSGTIAFFDWEACQAGCALEDLVKFVCNEMVPADLDPLDRLPELSPFAFQQFHEPLMARTYLIAFAALYMARRLNIIWGWQLKQGWSDWDTCLHHGLPGVSPRGIANLCRRAMRWCGSASVTADLVPWFEAHSALVPVDR